MEILNENPRITYTEIEYEGLHGYQEVTPTEIRLTFNKNANEKIKEIFKRSCVENILHPKQYKIIWEE